MLTLQEQFGPIDVYLFDQILRQRIVRGMRVLDAGCGYGRNLQYLLREGYEVFGVDADPGAIEETRALARAIAPTLPERNFRMEAIERMSFPDAFADVVLSSAVLHFAADEEQFAAMLRSMWRVLRPGGFLFCRLASTIGLTHEHVTGRRYLSPDGAERFLVDEAYLVGWMERLGGMLLDPIKTTVVQGQRCMTTWVARKGAAPGQIVSR